jgi:hypothetical protein
MAVLLIRAYEYQTGKKQASEQPQDNGFSDQANISQWALSSVQQAQALGLLQGKENNQFDPLATATRAQSAQVFYRLLQGIE